MNSSSNSNTNTNTNTRPRRQAAIEGEATRKETDAYIKKVDAYIDRSMGNADPKYTNSGHVRCEYLGTTRR